MKYEFNASNELAVIRATRKVRRRRRTCEKSVLSKYVVELNRLKESGGSVGDLQVWLRLEKRIIVERSTIWRFLNKNLPLAPQVD